MLVASRQRLRSIGGYHRESSYPLHGICTMWPIYVDNLSCAALKTLGISCICMDYRRSCRLWIWSSFMADCFEMHDSWEDRKILFPWCDGRLGKLERQTH